MSLRKQDPKKALFEDLIWSRPENRRSAGKLLIIGGQAGDFMNVSSAYSFAQEAGAGTVKALLPDSTRLYFSHLRGLPLQIEYGEANGSGSFAKAALGMFFELSDWADHVLLAGDFGKNSETTVILDGFLLRGSKPITVSQNALPTIGIKLEQLINMPVNLTIERKIFQKIGIAASTHVPITSLTGYSQMAKIIENISSQTKASYVIVDEEQTWCAAGGEVVSTATKPIDINALSAYSAVWLMQNTTKPLEAIATSVHQSIN